MYLKEKNIIYYRQLKKFLHILLSFIILRYFLIIRNLCTFFFHYATVDI